MKANSYLYKYDYNSSRGMWIGHIYDDKNQHIKFIYAENENDLHFQVQQFKQQLLNEKFGELTKLNLIHPSLDDMYKADKLLYAMGPIYGINIPKY